MADVSVPVGHVKVTESGAVAAIPTLNDRGKVYPYLLAAPDVHAYEFVIPHHAIPRTRSCTWIGSILGQYPRSLAFSHRISGAY